ncbi:hypothetical protein EV360DRAFT_87406 [Lentinula raphanica]|nr:hypothetical protein EV360DRAFT_87406 [Lentinula raphanica]
MTRGHSTFSFEREGTSIKTVTTHGNTMVDGFLEHSPSWLLLLIAEFTGRSIPPSDMHEPNEPKPLSICSLEELCPGIDKENVPELVRDRKQFTKLGQWIDDSGKFIVGLAISGVSENPWQPPQYNAHTLVAYVFVNDPAKYPSYSQWSIDIEVFIAEPEAGAKEHHFTREKTHLGVQRNQKVFPMMFRLDIETFLKKLQRYDSVWQFREANMIYTINWQHTEVRKPDVSGVKSVLAVTELILLVCDHLNLPSIEALRQTCKHFRSMQPLADIGRTRMQNALLYVFNTGDQLEREHRERIVKTFNALLLAGGSIVGGSTALHVLCPGNWLPADLDIVVREAQQAAMEDFLTEIGFVLNQERTRDSETFYPGGQDSDCREAIKFTYRRFENPIAGRAGVDLCIVHPWTISAPAEFVLTYHSTVVMNFWTGRSIHCLWPALTLKGKLLRNKFTPTPKVEAALRKYAQRGFYDIHDKRPKALQHWFGVRYPSDKSIRYLQDDYPNIADERLTIKTIPGPTWRKELVVV